MPVTKSGLVIGGGVSGMTSALSLAGQGFHVYLVERDAELGGMARRIHYTLEGMDVREYLSDLIRKVYRHPLMHVSTDSTITEATGYVGNFITRVKSRGRDREIRHGITIIATGAEEYKPTEYNYGEDDRVLTLLELEERIASGETRVKNSGSLAMIQCVGCTMCLKKCPRGAIAGDRKQLHVFSREKCIACGICFDVCPPLSRGKKNSC